MLDSINDLIDKVSESSEINLLKFDGLMSSADFNTNFDIIKTKLDQLYEKSRMLEQIYAYTAKTIEASVIAKKKELDMLLDEISKKQETFSISNVIAVSLKKDFSLHQHDRDHSPLPSALISDKKITTRKTDISYLPITHIEVKRSEMLALSNESDLIKDKPAHSIYVLKKPVKQIKEIYKLAIQDTEISSISLESNSQVVAIILIDKENRRIDVTRSAVTGFAPTKVKEVEIHAEVTDFRKMVYEESARETSPWHTLKGVNTAAYQASEMLYNIEQDLKIDLSKKKLIEWLQSIERWN